MLDIFHRLISDKTQLPIEIWGGIFDYVPIWERWGATPLIQVIATKADPFEDVPYQYMANWKPSPEFTPVSSCVMLGIFSEQVWFYMETIEVSIIRVKTFDKLHSPTCRIRIPLHVGVILSPQPPDIVEEIHRLVSMRFQLHSWVFNFSVNTVIDILFQPVAYHIHQQDIQLPIASNVFVTIEEIIDIVNRTLLDFNLLLYV